MAARLFRRIPKSSLCRDTQFGKRLKSGSTLDPFSFGAQEAIQKHGKFLMAQYGVHNLIDGGHTIRVLHGILSK